ncbi:MAG TPA: UDP-2,4-diacetamido-2,4,6-trideoxy-beta-L-altropyranose hydrolase [Thermoanaerobaculia bacterium]|nr:UDP-2,4-diacetamido-2,4,6-trideoxy-beta-L-altropyranose hydrolase [Thermoanaerobaculia bacterium]
MFLGFRDGAGVNRTILVRADAGPRIGIGHAMRCLALAQAWKELGGAVVFTFAAMPADLQERFRAEGFGLAPLGGEPGSAEDARATASLVRRHRATGLVLDGYAFDGEYLSVLDKGAARLLLIVDAPVRKTPGVDFVLDQNLGAEEGAGSSIAVARHLSGPRYALLRREFWPWRGWKRPIEANARRVLVTLGGSDPDNVTARVVADLRAMPNSGALETRVVVGPANRNKASIARELESAPATWRILESPADMPEVIRWADLAISGGGSTCWELAFLGLPCLTVVLADNQAPIASALARAGVTRDLGRQDALFDGRLRRALGDLLEAVKLREEMSRRGQEIVDGEGAERVASLLATAA